MNAPPQFSPKADIPTLLLVAQVVAPVPARRGSASGPSQSGALPSAHGLRRAVHGGLHLLNTRAV